MPVSEYQSLWAGRCLKVADWRSVLSEISGRICACVFSLCAFGFHHSISIIFLLELMCWSPHYRKMLEGAGPQVRGKLQHVVWDVLYIHTCHTASLQHLSSGEWSFFFCWKYSEVESNQLSRLTVPHQMSWPPSCMTDNKWPWADSGSPHLQVVLFPV